jgi:hypothetical protein
MKSKGHKVYVLYGSAKRDPKNEQVCMFFDSKKDLREFVEILPGRYRVLTLRNHPVKGEDFNVDTKLEPGLLVDTKLAKGKF